MTFSKGSLILVDYTAKVKDTEEVFESTIEEEARLRIWESRRGQIRQTLKSAENLRNFRLKNGFVPENLVLGKWAVHLSRTYKMRE